MYNVCEGNNASLQTIAKRIPYAALHISKQKSICLREVDVLYTSCLFLYETAKKGGSEIKQPIVSDIRRVTYMV